jgi:hypothetical protein
MLEGVDSKQLLIRHVGLEAEHIRLEYNAEERR